MVAWLAGLPAEARVIHWYCDASGSKQFSSGFSLDSRMHFELGVFTGTFVPTSGNKDQWASHWQAAQRVSYNPGTGVFTGVFTVENNDSPFVQNKRAYIWGFSPEYAGGEWILASHTNWKWPVPDPFNPNDLYWNIAQATEVLAGAVNSVSPPYVLRTSAVSPSSPPPLTTWTQWQAEKLAGEPLNGPGQDPDHDGSTNAEEYAHATDPKLASSVARVTSQWYVSGASRYLAIFVPVRPDRSLNLEFGTATSLTGSWDWTGTHTGVVSQSVNGWTVRCLDPVSAAPRRFLRARYTVP